MKKETLLAAMIAFSAMGLSVGCAGMIERGSGNLVSETYVQSDFSSVEAANGFEVSLTRSSDFSVEITADDNIIDLVEVSRIGDSLRVRLQPGYIYSAVTLRAAIGMPDLRGLSLSGGSQADITGFDSPNALSLVLSGGSGIAGDITAGDAAMNLSGGSSVKLSGTAGDLVVAGSGGSVLDIEAFPVDNADVSLSGGGGAVVNVGGTLNVGLSGGATVIYIGDPTLGDVELSGGSVVREE